MTELGLGRNAAVRQRVPHGGAEVEVAAVAATAPLGQARGQRARQRVDGALEGEHLLARRVHEVDVLGKRLAQRACHGFGAAVGDEPSADLGLDQLLQLPQAGLELLLGQALGQVAVADLAPLAGLPHQTGGQALEVQLPQRSIEVVGAADGPSGFHPGEAVDGHARQLAELLPVHVHERLEQHLRQLLG